MCSRLFLSASRMTAAFGKERILEVTVERSTRFRRVQGGDTKRGSWVVESVA